MTEIEFTTHIYRSIKARLIQSERMRQRYRHREGSPVE